MGERRQTPSVFVMESIQHGAPTQTVATPAPEPGAGSATSQLLTTLGCGSSQQFQRLSIAYWQNSFIPRNVRVLKLRLRPALGAAVWTQGKMAQWYPPTIPITIRTTLTKLTRLKWKQDPELRYPSLILIWSLLQIANMTTAKVKLYRKIYCEA